MRYTFGLIGSGNMGGAIARAVSLTLKDGILADHSPQRAQELAAELGFSSGTNEDAARESQYLFLGVKPHLMGGMLEGIRPTLASRETSPILVSMAAGLTIAQIQQMKKDMADLIADELLMKVVGIAALIIHDKFGMLMKKEVDGKSSINSLKLEE